MQTGNDLTRKESAEMIEEVLSIIKSTLVQGRKLNISGFGSFVVKQLKDRKGCNPQTGETIILPARFCGMPSTSTKGNRHGKGVPGKQGTD